jgi:GTP diphosphokinase / guanosine-3',5'-bis(diphosphate) 3'-diphosphatase
MPGWHRCARCSEHRKRREATFLGDIRPGLYADEVFVFTPKGEVRQLPVGSTLLDFAFDIHTEVGSKCIGGKINGRNVQLKQKLQNGDHVSVITSVKQTPKRDWLSFVITNKARTKIRQALNEEKFKLAAEGKETLTRRLKNWKIPYGDATVVKLLTEYGFKTSQDLYFSIAIGEIDLLQLKKVLLRLMSILKRVCPGRRNKHSGRSNNIRWRLSCYR